MSPPRLLVGEKWPILSSMFSKKGKVSRISATGSRCRMHPLATPPRALPQYTQPYQRQMNQTHVGNPADSALPPP